MKKKLCYTIYFTTRYMIDLMISKILKLLRSLSHILFSIYDKIKMEFAGFPESLTLKLSSFKCWLLTTDGRRMISFENGCKSASMMMTNKGRLFGDVTGVVIANYFLPAKYTLVMPIIFYIIQLILSTLQVPPLSRRSKIYFTLMIIYLLPTKMEESQLLVGKH